MNSEKTLEELENNIWRSPKLLSGLVTTCHRLRKKPINQFTVGDLRIMIGQNIGLKNLLPIALDILEVDPMAEGDYFEGDLLMVVLRCDVRGCENHQIFFEKIRAIGHKVLPILNAIEPKDEVEMDLLEAISAIHNQPTA